MTPTSYTTTITPTNRPTTPTHRPPKVTYSLLNATTTLTYLHYAGLASIFDWDAALDHLLTLFCQQRAKQPHAAPFGGSIACDGEIRFFLEMREEGKAGAMPFCYLGRTSFGVRDEGAAKAWESQQGCQGNPTGPDSLAHVSDPTHPSYTATSTLMSHS
ncbi:uncharacterized protein BO97DRAFT_417415 [Aspergillus homomorphus CBS 101889]|uniref:Uncharacterized protein n=1 Tax=Aspergillus homomorphus (strain CBS 101889) TaxID=1450537 RepID=A0A395HR64_ASPHC|nr:hypothetical protein BO97DRAFT_417415 [Aspergillus homomorphus CBS 101889]RAL08744.1 hypothetical protein BO97DRAFT_417415 [Aspergillus homomorphus CBS 101889]